MKLNKKGVTLVELLISIVLISIVLGFMYKLLSDIRYEKDNNTYAINNQTKRIEIIEKIENDLISKNLTTIDDSASTLSALIIKFTFADSTSSILTVTKDNISYVMGTDKNSWDIEDGWANYTKAYFKYYNDTDTNNYYVNLRIEIYTNNIQNDGLPDSAGDYANNLIDDITIFYTAKNDGMGTIPNKTCLGKGC